MWIQESSDNIFISGERCCGFYLYQSTVNEKCLWGTQKEDLNGFEKTSHSDSFVPTISTEVCNISEFRGGGGGNPRMLIYVCKMWFLQMSEIPSL